MQLHGCLWRETFAEFSGWSILNRPVDRLSLWGRLYETRRRAKIAACAAWAVEGNAAGHLNIDCMTKGGCDSRLYRLLRSIANALVLVLGLYEMPPKRRQDEGGACGPPPPGQLDRGPKLGAWERGGSKQQASWMRDGDESSSPRPARGEEVPQDLFDICDTQCPPPLRRFSGWASDEQSPAATQASRDDRGGQPVLRETPIGKVLISQALGATCGPNGTQTQGKEGPRFPSRASLECCSGARCHRQV